MKRLRCSCKLCGAEIRAKNGEELLQRKIKHRADCHPGFTEVIQTIASKNAKKTSGDEDSTDS